MNKEIPLLIQTKSGFGGVAAGKRGDWSPIDGVYDFIDNILTNDIDTDSTEEQINAIISGIPSPWARALIFKYALNFDPAHHLKPTGLMRYYESLQNEWKGLLACVALNNDKITVRKIELKASREDEDEDYEFYEVKGALGRMLFDDEPIWGNPDSIVKHPPYLQAILYNVVDNGQLDEVVIGSTSPFSVLFTPPRIKVKEKGKVPFYESGRFVNPLRTPLTASQVQLLYDYVNVIKSNIFVFGNVINKGREAHEKLDFDVIAEFLARFQTEIKEYAYRRGEETGIRYTINIDNIISTEPHFKPPFDIILNAESKVYIDDQGLFYLRPKEGTRLVTLNNLLLDSSNELVEVGFSKDEKPERSAAYLLQAGSGYFALPFTVEGMRTFQGNLKDMVNAKNDEGSALIAEMTNDRTREIKVSLRLKVYKDPNGTSSIYVDTTKVYQTRQIKNQRIIAWPDFISLHNIWNDYYLYSELPHNTLSEIKAFPLLLNGDRIKEDGEKGFYYACSKGSGAVSNVRDANIIVPQPVGTSDKSSYEIYHSKVPIVGVEIRIGASEATKGAGYLIGRIEKGNPHAFLPNDHRGRDTMTPVNVGIDFGSNNTCVGFQRPQSNPEMVHFRNRRRALLGSDILDPHHELDSKHHELFFFQKEEPKGKFRSLLQIHSDNRLEAPTTDVRQVAMGGFPVFERNVPIVRLDPSNREFNYWVDLNGEYTTIKYNMKWAGVNLIKENGYKHSFIRSIWLMTNAELMSNGFYPERVSWAYPHAMSDRLHRNYEAMWKGINPVIDVGRNFKLEIRHMTESEAVAQFAIDTQLGHLSPGNHELSIGFDVGGSTTDVLMIVQRDKNDYLVRQSSLLIAAGHVAQATQNSARIRDSLRSFVRDKSNPVKVWGIGDEKNDRLNEENAPFFLNAVFDRLSDRRVEELYRHFYEHGSTEIFALVAFITGFLMFYAGQLAAAIMQQQVDSDIRSFKIGFFGRGGNIFNWITTVLNRDGAGENYFRLCFIKGLESIQQDQVDLVNLKLPPIVLDKGTEYVITSDYKTNYDYNKTEVAYGLSTGRKIQGPTGRYGNQVDIIGERGYSWDGESLPATAQVTHQYLQNVGGRFRVPDRFHNLEVFVKLFSDFIMKDSPETAALVKSEAKRTTNLRGYIQGLPQFQDAEKVADDEHFDFKAPLIVLAGMYLIEEVILKRCIPKV